MISGYEGSKPRKVLITAADLPRVLGGADADPATGPGDGPGPMALDDGDGDRRSGDTEPAAPEEPVKVFAGKGEAGPDGAGRD
ncbi:MAG: hypothetical protein JJE10_11375 [Thermoleophilia bacterium]|nr:hypothetical protein [Thermoleophilia bacterium]